MATIKLPTSNEQKLELCIDNGDFAALQEIIAKFNFKDEASVIRFAIAVLSKAETKGIYIEDSEGIKIKQVPGKVLLAEKSEEINPE